MVSAAKFARAEKDLKAARPLGTAAQAFYEQAEVICDGNCHNQWTSYHTNYLKAG